ncbi:MAG: DUF2914 domain-containing protein [Candidatus Vogelbacteria bacterium]|nr:DUF2914 domain-containing protein [Candidatus Vogelbacteria bacterium]
MKAPDPFIFIMKQYIEKITARYLRYERHLSSVALLSGFIFDSLTLRRIDLPLENAILLGQLFLASFGIALVNLFDAKIISGRLAGRLRTIAQLAIQFSFGALFSGLVVFYFRSSSLGANWPFLFVLAALLVGNEFFRLRYQILTFQASIFFIALFSYLIFFIPVLVGAVGPSIFLLSGAVSLCVMALLYFSLRRLMPAQVRASTPSLVRAICGIYLAMNALYFANLIPPVPLAMKEAGVFRSVERISGTDTYRVTYEDASWYRYFRPYDVIHVAKGEGAYVFSSIFAPTRLNTLIYHQWQFYDEQKEEWLTTDRLAFPIFGGRDGGYRGYTAKSTLSTGQWRVDIVTERGQRIGRVRFLVARPDESLNLISGIR